MSRSKRDVLGMSARGGFTLVELLVVLVVILILVAIVVFTAPAIITGQQEKQTEAVLASLDRALQEYEATQGRYPALTETLLELFDASDTDALSACPIESTNDEPLLPDAWLFLEPASGFGSVDEVLSGVPGSFARTTIVEVGGDEVATRQMLDAWGNAVLYVHPSNASAQALYGRCPNQRPYFMSAGPDGKYGLGSETGDSNAMTSELAERALGFLEDNVYSVTPGNVRDDIDSLRGGN